MKEVGKLKLYTFDEVLDEQLGTIGSSRRETHEKKVEAALQSYRIGEMIKRVRLEQDLTQAELGEKVGVKKAQISRLERGCNITLPTMSKIFMALGITTASLDLGNLGKITLW